MPDTKECPMCGGTMKVRQNQSVVRGQAIRCHYADLARMGMP